MKLQTRMNPQEILQAISNPEVYLHRILRFRLIASVIIEKLQSDTCIEAIVDALHAKFNLPFPILYKEVEGILNRLRKVNLLDESIAIQTEQPSPDCS